MADKARFARIINDRLRVLDRSAAWLAREVGENEVNISRWRDDTRPTMPRDPAVVHALAAALAMSEAEEAAFFAAAGLVYQPPVAETNAALIQPDAATVAAYLEAVRGQCGRTETRPYRQLSELRGAPPSFTLLDEAGRCGVYVPLRFDLNPARAAGEGLEVDSVGRMGKKAREQTMRDLSRTDIALAEALASPGHVVFIGAAGCGKTTVLRLVAATLAGTDVELARRELGIKAGLSPLPVYLALRDFEHACATAPAVYRRDVDSLLRFVDDHFARWNPGRVPDGFVSGLVRTDRAWLLLDALDEVADFDHRIAVRQVIEKLGDAFPGNRLLVTARVAAYAAANTRLDERFQVATVRPLTREQWAPMVERLYAGLEVNPDIAVERARRLLARIDAAPQLQEMVKTPLMVWTATLIHYADRELPEQRAELYRAYVDVLLGERLHEEESAEAAQRLRDERWSMDDRLLYLTYAAYQAHEGEEKKRRGGQVRDALVVVDEQDLVKRILAPFMARNMMLSGEPRQVQRQAEREASEFLAFMAERSGLLDAHAEGYSFGDHLTVQEYLTASYLIDNMRGPADWLGFLAGRAGQSWWQEVFLLMAGHLLRRSEQARRFLLEELGALPGDGDAHVYGLAWAGRALLEIPPRRVAWHDSARDELARRLVQVLWKNPPATLVAARVEAGEVLGRLGDPRFSGPHLLPEFIPLAGGTFWMGSDEAEVAPLIAEAKEDWLKDAFKRETPRHRVALSPFALAKYPTTNAMFGRFVEAGGYADAHWWPEAKADRRWANGKVRDWVGERSQPQYWDNKDFNGPSQPVVGVTWYEAVAYCRWLTATLNDGDVYRLPTEAEWERAARGLAPTPGPSPATAGERSVRYPWGDEWIAGRCNSKELGLERTTPAGIFPDGGSAEGVLDLAGNVWEWCSDWFDEKTYTEWAGRVTRDPAGPASGQYRVLRGGSWGSGRSSVRCAYRYRGTPDSGVDNYGFRVARSSLR